MSLQIYNSLTKQKELFEAREPGKVRMYVCGPTVYGLLHVGNFRGPIFFNLVRNWLQRSGFLVTAVFNFTDVDDKIIRRAESEGVSSEQIANTYIDEFRRDFAKLELKPHSHNPRVTEHMDDIVRLIGVLIDKGHAYRAGGDVVYAIDSFSEYGKLSHRQVDELRAGHRVEVDKSKQNPLDFVLWKAAKPGEPSWPSPWGEGRPGWHIECSAMARALLGDQLDIHGGGSDLIFPHHENEIAQSEGATGKAPFARYWMHNNMLTFGEQKMSKSLGNIRTARSFLEQYHPEIFKYLMLSVHYRSLLDFSDLSVHRATSGLARIYSALALAEKIANLPGAPGEQASAAAQTPFIDKLKEATAQAKEALDDDFNTAEWLARIFDVVRAFNFLARPFAGVPERALGLAPEASEFIKWVQAQGALGAILQEPPGQFLLALDDKLLAEKGLTRAEIQELVDERSQARVAKNFKESDRLRALLVEKGVLLYDSPKGSDWEVHK